MERACILHSADPPMLWNKLQLHNFLHVEKNSILFQGKMRSQSQFDVLVTTALWVGGFFSTFGLYTELSFSQLTWKRMSKNISLPD